MQPIPLDPGDYDGTYKLLGGALSLDFVNTVSWPGSERAHDWLDRPGNLAHWAMAAGLVDAGGRAALDQRPAGDLDSELAAVRRARAELRELLWPLAHGARPDAAAIATLNERLKTVPLRRHVDSDSLAWAWAGPERLTDLLAPVVWDAAQVVTGEDPARISHCPSCDWLFLDTTRNRSRRWCDMADCGSRDKALRYYHRTKAAGTPKED